MIIFDYKFDKRAQFSYNGIRKNNFGGIVLEVDIDKILPVTEARDSFNKIVDEVEGTDHMYVLTKNGKPAAVVVGVNHLEKLTGKSTNELTSMVEKKADETPVVEEIKTEPASPPETPTEEVVPPPAEPTAPVTQTMSPAPPPPEQGATDQSEPPLNTPNDADAETPTEAPAEPEKKDDLFV